MTWSTNTKSKHLSVKLTAGFAIATIFAIGAFAGSASAEWRGGDHRGGDHRGYSGGYYPAPPVAYYGTPYYAPPVVYGPGIGVSLPGINIGVR